MYYNARIIRQRKYQTVLPPRRSSKTKKRLFLAAVVLLGAAFFLRDFFRQPDVSFLLDSEKVGVNPFSIKFSGGGKGLKRIEVFYIGAESNRLLLKRKRYSEEENIREDTVAVSLNPIAGIEDGPAEIEAVCESYGGLRQTVTKTASIVADLSPPKITVLSATENMSQGGSGVVVYKISGDTVKSGVRIGDSFFKGYKASGAGFTDENIRISFFSYPYNLPEGETVLITASDDIGNRRNLPINYNLIEKPFTELDIQVTEKFIKMKMLPMINASGDVALKDMFLLVNRKVREANNRKIEKALSQVAEKIMWEGRFIRPSGSLQSQFEKRKYFFEGEQIDEQYHLGYDIASQKKNPVRASNNGVVIFADDLGIYGNAVIIDHGMGLATLYAHLSSMTVQTGDAVATGDRIGSTGDTGLAFGDHLHFGIYVGGQPVLPTEWWDQFWVRTRITQNIQDAKAETSATK